MKAGRINMIAPRNSVRRVSGKPVKEFYTVANGTTPLFVERLVSNRRTLAGGEAYQRKSNLESPRE
jgi:hypothetical protein